MARSALPKIRFLFWAIFFAALFITLNLSSFAVASPETPSCDAQIKCSDGSIASGYAEGESGPACYSILANDLAQQCVHHGGSNIDLSNWWNLYSKTATVANDDGLSVSTIDPYVTTGGTVVPYQQGDSFYSEQPSIPSGPDVY